MQSSSSTSIQQSTTSRTLVKRKRPGGKIVKVRTGCITCKVRRVKCDETKPRCLRCVKFDVKCDGYLESYTPERRQKKISLQPNLPPCVYVRRFENEPESQYFQVFCSKTAVNLSGCFDSVLWSRTILQESERYEALRHAVIAIGALDKSAERVAQWRTHTPQEHALAKTHYIFALSEYSKCIKEMRRDIFEQKFEGIRTSLLASMLVVCFENYLGNHASASRQVHAAGKMLVEWTSQQSKPRQPHAISPAPDIIEDELVNAFVRLDLHSNGHTNSMTLEEHRKAKSSDEELLKSMPKVMTDLKDARTWSNISKRRLLHFLYERWQSGAQTKTETSMSYFDAKDGLGRDAKLKEEQEKYMAEHRAYEAAFAPLFHRSRTTEGGYLFYPASAIRIHNLEASLAMEYLLRDDEMAWDDAWDTFREMLDLSQHLINIQKFFFIFDLETVWSLDIIGRKCRDPTIRRRAIDLLLCRPRREGSWDAVATGKICTWVMELEETGLVAGFVPEEYRVRNIGTKMNLGEKVALAWCEQPKLGSSPREMIRKETTIRW